MAQPKTKEQLVRMAWVTELRRQGHRQCYGAYYEGNKRVCALGLLAEIAEVNAEKYDEPSDVGSLAGMTEEQSSAVWCMNDGESDFHGRKHTFAEIADVVEGWFPNG